MRIDMDASFAAHVEESVQLLLEHIGSEVETDAKAACPVRTGKLRDSIEHEVVGETLRVGSNVPYAVDVEEGHRIVAWGHDTGRMEPPEAFLKPALYKTRGV